MVVVDTVVVMVDSRTNQKLTPKNHRQNNNMAVASTKHHPDNRPSSSTTDPNPRRDILIVIIVGGILLMKLQNVTFLGALISNEKRRSNRVQQPKPQLHRNKQSGQSTN